ncbi:MAG TPA: hypothetical protein VJV22_20225 [Acidobacteriaceae bacterium]|nr:hypothetical protein [Acidobacteriaceae bacterium]
MENVSKRIAAGVLGVLAILCGIAGLGYWLLPLSLGAFWLGADFLKFAVTGQPFRIPQRLRAVIVSLLSFFPGFLLGLCPLLFYEVHQHPDDSQAAIRAFVIAAVVGLASVLAVGFVLLRKSRATAKR